MGPVARIARWIGGGVLGLLLLAAGLVFLLLRSQPGHDFFLRTALRQLPGWVNGEIEIGGLRSDGLLRGFRLHDISIRAPDGRSFLEADSLEVRYALGDLLARRIALVPARIWSPVVTLEPAPGDSVLNVVRIFGGGEPAEEADPERSGTGLRVVLRRVEIHDGAFTLHLPITEGEGIPGGVTVPAPEGEGRMQSLEITGIDARFDEVDILDPDRPGERIVVDRLSLEARILEEPVRLEDFRGVLVREGGRFALEADRLWLPRTELSGDFAVDWSDPEAGVRIEADLVADVLAMDDFRWLEPRLPEGEGSLQARFTGPVATGSLRIGELDLRVEGSRVAGRLGVDFDDRSLVDTELQLDPFDLALLDPFLPSPLPVEGRLRGRIAARGPPEALDVEGALGLETAGSDLPPWIAEMEGRLHLEEALGATAFRVRIDPLPWSALAAFVPEVPWAGTGRVEVVADGRLRTGLALEGTVEHALPSGAPSRVGIEGTIALQEDDGPVRLALDALLDPLSLDGIAGGIGRELPLSGELRGRVRVDGPLDDLTMAGRIETVGGVIDATARLDPRDPLRRVAAEGSIEAFDLHALFDPVPDRTELSGAFTLDGGGGTLESLEGTFDLAVRDSRVAGLEVEGAELRLHAEDGRVFLDSLDLRSALLTLTGRGDFPLDEDLEEGEVEVRWDAASMAALRPFLFGEAPIAADTLSALERQVLIAQGVNPDTLVVEDQIVLEGRMAGAATLRGWLHDVRGEAMIEAEEAVYGSQSLAAARASVTGRWTREGVRELQGRSDFEGLQAAGFAFASGEAEATFRSGEGDFRLALASDGVERYEAAGDFRSDSTGVDLTLDRVLLDLDEVQWSLAAPARVRVAGAAMEIEGFRITRPGAAGAEAVTIGADGRLDLEGDSDLTVRLSGVDLLRVGRIAQSDRLPTGILALDLHLRGPAGAPRMSGAFQVRDFAVGGTSLTLLEGTAEYAARRLSARVTGILEGRELLAAEGIVPIDLAFTEVADRIPDQEVTGRIVLTDLPASTALSALDVLEEVEGVFNGEIVLGGTPSDFRPTGELRLRGGSVLLAELGIRPSEIDADFRLLDDGLLEIEGSVRSQGTARIAGVVSLSDLANPAFEGVTVVASGFQAIQRRDLAARVGGDLRLRGSYQAPRIEGGVVVEGGELFVDEVVRSAEVVDLTDPSYFDVIDAALEGSGAGEAPNPFLQNLRVEVDLALERDFWLRSGEMDVELAGDLIVTFDRREREILLVGSLEPVRGTYATFGRQFQVQGGTIEFVGIPGINPALNIDAATRLRTEGGEPLQITANVGGTLLGPRVTLSSDAQPPIAESDLISYLLFGRPSYALASAEAGTLNQAVTAQVVGQVTGALSLLGRGIGLDYFSITQASDPAGLSSAAGLSGTFALTQIELGQYLAPNLFLAVVLRPLGGLQTGNQAQIPGARVEWRFTDTWSMEGFVEDRFAREGTSGFGELGIRLSKVFGLSLYRAWGY